jgi:ComF family protein
VSNWAQKLLDLSDTLGANQVCGLLYPPECAMCQGPVDLNRRLCSACEQHLVSNRYSCQRCAMPVPIVLPNDSCSRCREHRWNFSRVVALGHYQGKLREAVILCKKIRFECLRYALAVEMLRRLRDQIPELLAQDVVILPVPNHWTRSFARTAPTADSLAQLLSGLSGWPVLSGMVSRTRRTRKQGMLSLAERQENVRGAFRVNRPKALTGRHVVIVDDVLTSGATADELAKQLRLAKPFEISVVAIARATGS